MISKAEAAAFEVDIRKRYLPLAKRLRKVEDDIAKLVVRSMSNARLGASYWRKQTIKLDLLYGQMNTLFDSWAKINVPYRYKRSLRQISERIGMNRFILNTAKKNATELLVSNASRQIVFGLYSSSVESFLSASTVGKAALRNLFITAQQTLVDESLINVAIGTSFEMGDLRQAKTLLTTIFESPAWQMVKENQFVQAGRYRYRPSYYAELLARTKFHQAHSQATLVQSANYGTDLVEVSSHNTTTAICIPFEGNIYSTSGTHKIFPPLSDTPPYHPNCLHLMYPTFESGLRAQGILNEEGELVA